MKSLMSGNEILRKPLVSVIMNCYNGESYLKEAIDSVISQSYSNWELIFWDNQSTDKTKSIVTSYSDSRLKYHIATNKTPLSEARNLAIEKAQGEYLAFLDSDDIWDFRKLEFQMNAILSDKSVGIAYCGFETLLTSDNLSAINQANYYSKFKYVNHSAKPIYNLLLQGNFIVFSTVIISTEIFKLTGGFSENLSQNEDYEILLKAACHTNAICIAENLVKYRIHSSNNSYQNEAKSYVENSYIFSLLPKSKELEAAINRNETRRKLSSILIHKNSKELLGLLNPKYFGHLVSLIIKKIVK